VRAILGDLAQQAIADLQGEGLAADEIAVEQFVDCRYLGQSHELRIAAPHDVTPRVLVDSFHEAHQERYGFARPDDAVEAVTFRAAATGPAVAVDTGSRPGGDAGPVAEGAVRGSSVPVYDRGTLASGTTIDGPAIVRELDSTTWLDAHSSASVHGSGALVVHVS
jgi:N-methylhydantoinase A/oxoprolinase/acetone carboxylase beta subunit